MLCFVNGGKAAKITDFSDALALEARIRVDRIQIVPRDSLARLEGMGRMESITDLGAERRQLIEFFGNDSRFVSEADDMSKIERQKIIEAKILTTLLGTDAAVSAALWIYVEPDGDYRESEFRAALRERIIEAVQ